MFRTLSEIRGIEVAGRLVGEHNGRLVDQCARQRHPLLFAAGKLGRAMRQALCETQQSYDFIEVGGIAFPLAPAMSRAMSMLERASSVGSRLNF